MEEEQPAQAVKYVIERKARKATGVWLLVAQEAQLNPRREGTDITLMMLLEDKSPQISKSY